MNAQKTRFKVHVLKIDVNINFICHFQIKMFYCETDDPVVKIPQKLLILVTVIFIVLKATFDKFELLNIFK